MSEKMPVSLKALVSEVDAQDASDQVLLRLATGEVLTITSMDWQQLNAGEETDFDEDIDQELRQWNETGEGFFVSAPERNDFNEPRIIRHFCEEVSNGERLYRAFSGGRGAFRRFKEAAADMGLLDQWYAFRTQAIADILRGWLAVNEIPFTDDLPRRR